MSSFIISNYSGLNSHADDHELKKNEASMSNNIRYNSTNKSISKRKIMLKYGSPGSHSINGLHRFYTSSDTKQLLVFGSTLMYLGDDSAGTFTTLDDGFADGNRWQCVTYLDHAVCGNGSDQPIKYDGATTTTANTDGARTATELTAELCAPFAELDTGTDLDASSWYQYKVAFYDGTTYSFSNAKSNPILTGSSVHNIALTDIPLGPAGTTQRIIYRISGNATQAGAEADSTYYRVDTISDNTTTTYADSVDDTTLETDTAPTWATVSAGVNVTPPKFKYLTIHEQRIFGAGVPDNLSTLYWSEPLASYQLFDPTDTFDVRPDDGDKITFLKVQLEKLIVGKDNSIQKFYTDQANDQNWSMSNPFSFTGSPAPYSAVNSPIGIIYLGRDGLYRFGGQYSEYISDPVTPEIRDILQTNLTNVAGVYFGNQYHLSYTSIESGETSNNRVLIYDAIRNAYTVDTKNINSWEVFDSGDDLYTLYSGDSSTSGSVFAHEENINQIKLRKKSEFDDGTYDDVRAYNDEDDPILEIAWDSDIDNWLTELQTKDGSINTINDIVTYLPNATINRPDTAGTWTSPVYQINASQLDEIIWNEQLNGVGDITWQVRTGPTSSVDGSWTSFSSAVSDPLGSDISGTAGNTYIQIRVNLSTTDIDVTPILYLANGFVVKLTYDKAGTTSEGNVLSEWESGWIDFGSPASKKIINQIKIFYTGSAEDLNIRYFNEEGEYDQNYDIDMSIIPPNDDNDDGYTDYFGVGDFKYHIHHPKANDPDIGDAVGQNWKIALSHNGQSELTVRRIEVIYSVQPFFES